MAWNLPKAWSPGLVLPGYVRAEGLQRRAFVTQWQPNGTFDNPKVNDGGYVQPQYVLDEGYGNGAYITKWAPRGSYFGPKIPHFLDHATAKISKAKHINNAGGYEVNLQSLSGTDPSQPFVDHPLPEPFESFGSKAAAVILSGTSGLPRDQRRGHLKKVLDKIDRSLWARTAGIAGVLSKHGMPPQRALARGLAKALGSGMAAEVIRTGHQNQPPPATGLLGLGCYGYVDGKPLGAYEALGSLATAVQATGAVNKSLVCIPNPPPGFTYDYACPSGKTVTITTGPRAGTKEPVMGCFRPVGPNEPVIKKRGAANQCITFDELKTNYHGEPSFMVGPFTIPISATSYNFGWRTPSELANLPPAWLGAIQAAFNPNTPGKDSANPQTVTSSITPGVPEWLTALGVPQPIDMNVIATPKGFTAHWYDLIPGLGWLGLLPGVVDAVYQGIANVDDLTGPPQPIAQFQHPKTGDQWGAWITIKPKKSSAPDPVTNPIILGINFGRMPDSPWYQNLLADLFWPVVELTKGAKFVVTKTLEIVGALACAAVSGPGAVQGGATAGGLAGGPPGAAAGAAGASIAALACGTQPVYAPQDSWLMPVVIAAAIGGLAYVFTRPKRKPAGTTPKPGGTP